jgi:hypothetical protein
MLCSGEAVPVVRVLRSGRRLCRPLARGPNGRHSFAKALPGFADAGQRRRPIQNGRTGGAVASQRFAARRERECTVATGVVHPARPCVVLGLICTSGRHKSPFWPSQGGFLSFASDALTEGRHLLSSPGPSPVSPCRWQITWAPSTQQESTSGIPGGTSTAGV